MGRISHSGLDMSIWDLGWICQSGLILSCSGEFVPCLFWLFTYFKNLLFLSSIMHPVKYHLTQKLTWMSRQLRSKNDAADLLDWITAMQSIYNLLVSFSEENCAVPCERSPCRRDLLISSHQGINYQATSTIDTSRTSTDPTGMQSRRVVKGKRTMKLRESKSTLRMTVKPQWSHNLNVNRAVSGE